MTEVGIDIGGTFTDVVVVQDGTLFAVKAPSTPGDLSDGVQAGLATALRAAGISPGDIDRFIHGTTVATNVMIEKTGARIGVMMTEGFEDTLEVGRQARPRSALYSISTPPQTPVFLAPRRRRVGISERVDCEGKVLVELDERNVREQARRLIDEEGVDAIAICFLFSFLNPDHELRARTAIREEYPEIEISLSSEVDPVFREYERLCMTCADAYVGSAVREYVEQLAPRIESQGVRAKLQIMQSNGAITSARNALERPVMLVGSGPAAGVEGAVTAGLACGLTDMVTIDIGGTSSDISVVKQGRPLIARESRAGVVPLRMPMIDVTSVGAGGGSIAWIDGGGAMRVGPASAGARPGPACYGMGGTEAAVTDASVVLGYLNPEYFVGGSQTLDVDAAQGAIGAVGERLGLGVTETALGIHRIANATMANRIHLMSVGRGHDLRRLGLVVLGGAGAIHGNQIADELSVPLVVVPMRPGVLSAFGLLVAAIEHQRSLTIATPVSSIDDGDLKRAFRRLEQEAMQLMKAEDVNPRLVVVACSADMCFAGQSYELEIPVDHNGRAIGDDAKRKFVERHREVYGHANPDQPVHIVNLHATARFPLESPNLPQVDGAGDFEPKMHRRVHFPCIPEGRSTPVFERSALGAGATIAGPAIIEQPDSTVVVHPGWGAEVRTSGEIVLQRGPR